MHGDSNLTVWNLTWAIFEEYTGQFANTSQRVSRNGMLLSVPLVLCGMTG